MEQYLYLGTSTDFDINREMINKYLAERYPIMKDNTLTDEQISTIDTSKIISTPLLDVKFWFLLKSTFEQLNNIYEECSSANWDGDNADPISIQTYNEALKLIRMLPPDFPTPEIQPESDGGVGLEWYKQQGFSFTISVNGTNIINYAGLFGENNQTYGTENLTNSLPKSILENLMRLYPITK